MRYQNLPQVLAARLIVFAIVLAGLFAPALVSAACDGAQILSTTEFVPLECYPSGSKLAGLFSTSGSLTGYLNTIFKAAISIGAILAVIRLAYAGYIYMGGDMWGNKERAKEIIRNVFLGILLLLSIFIILFQINPNLLNLTVITQPLNIPFSPTPSPLPNETGTRTRPDENSVRDALARGQVFVYNSPCTRDGQTRCTNVGGLAQRGVDGLLALKTDCQCQVLITGGTEGYPNHSAGTAHLPGNGVVDLNRNTRLDAYIQQTGTRTDDPNFIRGRTIPVYTINGAKYYQEDSRHWHVIY